MNEPRKRVELKYERDENLDSIYSMQCAYDGSLDI